MSIHLTRDLEELHRDIISLCALVEDLIQRAVQQLSDPSDSDVRELAERDREIDLRDVRIEENCLKILALHQPVAVDLRRITAVLKISAELERVADLAVHIAERATGFAWSVDVDLHQKLERMAQMAVEMLHQSIDAYVKLDSRLARNICASDGEVDDLNLQIINEIMEKMKENPGMVDSGMHLFSASKHLERVADHATNIAEDVVYLVEGEIIRHSAAGAHAQVSASPGRNRLNNGEH